MKGNFGRAFKVILGVIGASFFAAAFRKLLNFNGNNHVANAGVSLASAVILYAGLKAFKFTQAANAVMVGGVIVAGMALVTKPVTDAGTQVGAWLRGALPGQGNGGQQAALPNTSYQTQDMPQGWQEPQTFSALPPGVTPQQSFVPQQPQQPQSVTIIQEAQESNPWIDLASTGLQVGGQVLSGWLGGQQQQAGFQQGLGAAMAAMGSLGNPNDAFAKLTY